LIFLNDWNKGEKKRKKIYQLAPNPFELSLNSCLSMRRKRKEKKFRIKIEMKSIK